MFTLLFPELNCPAAFFDENKQPLSSSLPFEPDLSLLDSATNNETAYSLQKTNSESYVLTAGKLTLDEKSIYFLNAVDIGFSVAQEERMLQNFRWVYFATLGIGMVLTFLLSLFLTRPIKRLTNASYRISHGDYAQRLPVTQNDEIGELSNSFNRMADAIEDKMSELSQNARQKEDFVAAFAHELKTPLTSVIGYADVLYQKNLPPQETKAAAWYILNEGLRLETLARKLMDLIVLNRQDFVLEEMPFDEILQNACNGLAPLLKEKKVNLTFETDAISIRADFDLFKTLLLNLIDNAVKAGCSTIQITGRHNKGRYSIRVADDGCGIPQAELSRITEAFYMVDKSRSRKQYGAGLGLSLVTRIVEIHHGKINFDSHEGSGTSVTIEISCEGGKTNA
ncbi:HAMP domain-containing histidine kinase [Lachnospiraceae bacterium ZAX-1]